MFQNPMLMPMSGLIREHVNKKISQALLSFNKINAIIKDYDVKFFEYYEELREGMIKILNEIVTHYIYKRPELSQLERYKADYEHTIKENEQLRQRLEAALAAKPAEKPIYSGNFEKRKEWAPRSKSPLRKIEDATARVEELEKRKAVDPVSNGLLRWGSTKDFNSPINALDYSALSHKELKEFISELYEAKSLYDSGCKEQKVACESLEQFMYNHLKYRNGTNKAVVEWVFGTIEAIKIYAVSDNDVAVFKAVG